MDTIPESTATTLVRIEAIVIQGILRAILLAAVGILIFPISPFVLTAIRFKGAGMPLWWRILMIPYWFSLGIVLSALAPLSVLWRGLADTATIVCVEWRERWRNGEAKYPDGSQMLIPTESGKTDALSLTKGVIEDYEGIQTVD